MQQSDSTGPANHQSGSADFGIIPKPAEEFGMMRNDAEAFGTISNNAEAFRSPATHSERKENHTLTVREVARMFEAAGVARTERSIINWCQPNKMGIARLDFYFDPNERKYFISPQSVEAAIQEEKAKAAKGGAAVDTERGLPKDSETLQNVDNDRQRSADKKVGELEKEVLDLKITNRAKDFYIEQLKQEREIFGQERQQYVEKLMSFNRKVGQLEAKLLQIEGAKGERGHEKTE